MQLYIDKWIHRVRGLHVWPISLITPQHGQPLHHVRFGGFISISAGWRVSRKELIIAEDSLTEEEEEEEEQQQQQEQRRRRRIRRRRRRRTTTTTTTTTATTTTTNNKMIMMTTIMHMLNLMNDSQNKRYIFFYTRIYTRVCNFGATKIKCTDTRTPTNTSLWKESFFEEDLTEMTEVVWRTERGSDIRYKFRIHNPRRVNHLNLFSL